MPGKKVKEGGFEENLKELQEIVAALESGGVTLDGAVALFESGIAKTKSAMETLKESKGKITALKAELDSLLEEPYRGEDE